MHKILKIFGPKTAFIPVIQRTKKPAVREWTKIGHQKMDDPDYLKSLTGQNIAINCGKKSNGLISIDCDEDGLLDELLSLNPDLKKTTLSKGNRGGNIWIRIPKGNNIPKVIKIKNLDDKDIGEIRGTKGCTTVHGIHPQGMKYELKQEFPPITLALEEINWPSNVKNPLTKKVMQDLVENKGEPFLANAINEGYFIEITKLEYDLIWAEKDFHLYDEECGIWKLIPEESLRSKISKMISYGIRQQDIELKAKGKLHTKNKDSFHKGVTSGLKGDSKDFPEDNYRRIACKDGVLELNSELGTVQKSQHSPKHFLRNFHPFHFTEDEPKRFLEFLENNLDEDEVDQLHKIIGMILFGGNPLQKIVLFHGVASSGKSVLVNIIAKLVGLENYAQLRTKNLETRFETGNYLGKKLLIGSDVPENFLSCESAKVLKSLVGDDLLSCEKKHRQGTIPLKGDLGCLISSNYSLSFPQNDDSGAWGRRLVTFEFPNTFQGKKEVDLADKLIVEEVDAIFSWAVRGRELLQQDLNERGELFMNDKQKERVQRIAHQSCTVSNFVEERLVTENAITETTTTKEMHEEYSKFCLSDNLTMEPELVFSKELKSVLESTENVRASNSILDSSGKKVRGYRGVKIKGN